MKHIGSLFSMLVVLGVPTLLFKMPEDKSHMFKEVACYRPGFNITVEQVFTHADGQVEVDLAFSDDDGGPLDRAGIETQGALSISFILSRWNAESRRYQALTTRTASSDITGATVEQATSDSGGTWIDGDVGHATYIFNTPVDTQYLSDTHSIGIYATRNLSDITGENEYANVVHDFRPDGGEVVSQWDAFSNETCNSCHTQLAEHGGSRRDVKLCATCHNPGTTDPDTLNNLDLSVMVHKIHMGENLPSVQAGIPYQIIGFRNSVHDYSTVVFPRDNRDCTSCHRNDVSESHIWYSNPSIASCGSCHDDVNFVTGENHRAGPREDGTCGNCHAPEGELEFDASVIGAHVIPTQSRQLAGLNVDILDVANSGPGETMQVRFQITEDDGTPVDPAVLDRLRFLVGGPNTDYHQTFTQEGRSAAFDGSVATLAFDTPIPADASGSWTLSADVYRNLNIQDARGNDISVREVAFNPIFDFPVTDATAHSRRQIISQDNCLTCHGDLQLHGGQRRNVQECVMCHNPVGTDEEVRPEEAGAAESIHFAYMIHRIHKGEELQNDFTVYGFRSSVHNYNELRYPADLRDCESCHLPGTYTLPTPEEASETEQPRGFFSPMGPASTACLSCHESVDAAAHAYVNTAPFGESCGTCHGEGREYAVSKVHGL